MRALFGLLAIGAVACAAPAATPAPSPAGLPTAALGSDLVYLADQVGTQGASIVAMPSGAVIGRVEGYAYPAPYNQVGPRFGLFASTQDARVRVARVALGTGRVSVVDAGALAQKAPVALATVAGTPDGSRVLVAPSMVEGNLARTRVDAFDASGRVLASRLWSDEMPADPGREPSAWSRLVALGADRFLLVRSRWIMRRTLETWSVIDADVSEIASRSSDISWTTPGNDGPVPTVTRDDQVLWSQWCDYSSLLALPERGLWATACAGRGNDWRDKWIALVDGSLNVVGKIALPSHERLGDWVGWGARADGTVAVVTSKAIARFDPATGQVSSNALAVPRSFELFPVQIALGKITISPMLQFSPDGRLAYLVTYERQRAHQGIAVIDTATVSIVSALLKDPDVHVGH